MSKATTLTEGAKTFEHFGFSKKDAIKLEMRFCLSEAIRKFIEREDLTQTEAANFFGTSQPNISMLMNGNDSKFTIDRMVDMIAHTQSKITYSVKPARKGVINKCIKAGSFVPGKKRRQMAPKKQVA